MVAEGRGRFQVRAAQVCKLPRVPADKDKRSFCLQTERCAEQLFRGFLSSAFRVLRALVRIRKNLKATA